MRSAMTPGSGWRRVDGRSRHCHATDWDIAAMKLSTYRVMSFDCYGTLIDWEKGLVDGLRPLTAKLAQAKPRNQILETFAKHESAQQELTPAMPYSVLLSVVYRRLAQEWQIPVTNEEANIFGASIPDWPEFVDSVDAL